MMTSIQHAFVILMFFLFLPFTLKAQNANKYFQYNYTKWGAFIIQQSGEDKKSFTGSVNSAGLSASRVTANRWWGFETGVRGGSLSGSQKFDDNGTDVTSGYVYTFGEFFLLARVHLIPADKSGFFPYFGLAGVATVNSLNLDIPASTTLTVLQRNQSELGTGTELVAGGEIRIQRGAAGNNFYVLFLETGIRTTTAKLAGITNFNTGGFKINFGLGF